MYVNDLPICICSSTTLATKTQDYPTRRPSRKPARKVARSIRQLRAHDSKICRQQVHRRPVRLSDPKKTKLTLKVGSEEVDEAIKQALRGGVRDLAACAGRRKGAVVRLGDLVPVDCDVALGLEVLMSGFSHLHSSNFNPGCELPVGLASSTAPKMPGSAQLTWRRTNTAPRANATSLKPFLTNTPAQIPVTAPNVRVDTLTME